MKDVIPYLLKDYCKYKKVDVGYINGNHYRLSKKGLKIADVIVDNEKVTLHYETMDDVYSIDGFIKYLEKEINQIKFVRRTSIKCKRTFPLQYVKMKMVEHGKIWCHRYAEHQNNKFLGIKK